MINVYRFPATLIHNLEEKEKKHTVGTRMCIMCVRQCVATIALRSRQCWILYVGLLTQYSARARHELADVLVLTLVSVSVGSYLNVTTSI